MEKFRFNTLIAALMELTNDLQRALQSGPVHPAAWEEAVDALERAGIAPADVPLFLVLGRPRGPEDGLFRAAQLQLVVEGVPQRPAAPLHVYASAEAIYVSCAGASLLGRQAALLAGAAPASSPGGDDELLDLVLGSSQEDLDKTLGKEAGGHKQEIMMILARAQAEGRSPQMLTEEERNEIRLLLAEWKAAQAFRQIRAPRPNLLKDQAEVDLQTARLRHLCRLIARDRRPYCPVNGILLLVPLAASDSDDDAHQTALVCQHDLATAQAALQVHCPRIALVCDLETVPGFAEFAHHFPERQRQRRLGQRFPLVPAPEVAVPQAIEEMGAWIGRMLIPTAVSKHFRVEATERPEDCAAITRGNVRLFQFMAEMRERQKRIGRLLAKGVAADGAGPPLFGGCYLAGTGPHPRDQAFVAGVFRRLIENQDFVAWTADALAEEASYARWTRAGYIVITLFTAAALALVFFLWKQ